MKHQLYIILLCALLACGCTQSEGHIGKIFGSWVMTEMLVDGEAAQWPEGDYTTMSYQNNIVNFKYVDRYGYATGRWGTWTRIDNTLTLNFTHSTDVNPPGTGTYEAPTWLGFPSTGVFDMEITRLNNRNFDFTRHDADGRTYIYKFERTW